MSRSDQALRDENRKIFESMLDHLGKKEFDEFEKYLAIDFVQEWPYTVSAEQPPRLHGAHQLREFIEIGTSTFDPYNYRIHRYYECLDPDELIVEYSSHTRYLPRDKAYSNFYLGIVRFSKQRITFWREYLNPSVVAEALGDDLQLPMAERAS